MTSASLSEAIKALAHPLRRDMLGWLKSPETHFPEQLHPLELGVCAGQIQQKCGLSAASTSAHLAALSKAGLIRCQKHGQWHYYRRDEAAIEAFSQAIQAYLSPQEL
ncbi:ArsR/SmtB family transcription factor [Gilvimarinus algae]|uniref:Metalloregulator ArsR/SmtB family transcription factor n=1 Tax=Gilvimarinus algae TaxID=3058037 RepID=A0ABT8TLQ2_9GAMM|nr:metalloregulator ArsR/SmtB family transcription factor [Gilvimarinus sp. SDUM040014]MDO3384028.1 metalloregulator ArsR/SmtB family transcription factor [Gilvimarinus sp. SDUM040014]